jgi:hypothetical protein
MANVFDYLKWQGNLSFGQSPFNEVDSLIFSKLSCVDFTGIVPSPQQTDFITMSDAALQYFHGRENEKIRLGVLVPDDIPPLFKKVSECRRFCGLKLTAYVNRLCVKCWGGAKDE